MALDVCKLYIPDDIPPGQFAGKLIKAVYTDTKASVFPRDGPYGKDWKKAISFLNRKKKKATDDFSEQKKETNHEQNLEVCRSSSPNKSFMQWRVPSRYSDGGRPTSREEKLLKQIKEDTKRLRSGSHHTTHFVPPHGTLRPVKSEQQEQMEQVLKREEEIQQIINAKPTTLPRLSVSAKAPAKTPLPLEPKTFSAAQRWLKKNPGQEQLSNRTLHQFRKSEVDKVLEKTVEPNAQKAVREWLKNASESDRKAAIKFFSSVAGRRFIGGASGSHPDANMKGDQDARLRAILRTLERNRGDVPSRTVQRHQTVEDGIKMLMKAARRKHLRLLTPETRLRHKEFQTWHHMPVYAYKGRRDNVTTMFTLPNAPTPRDFRIHPEWEV